MSETFKVGAPVVYRGKTYSFPGAVCGITDDGQIIVRAVGTPEGYYAGMKHIFGPTQLEPWEPVTPPPQPHVLGVKPLEWRVYPEDGRRMAEGQNQQRNFVSRALLPWGHAFFVMEKDGIFTLEGSTEVFFDTEQDAKDEAQSQFETWIRAALATATPEGGE